MVNWKWIWDWIGDEPLETILCYFIKLFNAVINWHITVWSLENDTNALNNIFY